MVVVEGGLPYACNLLPANQIGGYHTTLTLVTMSVDAEYEVVVDAALAFGGLDQHDALKLPLRPKCA
jgi:hypothetical protein